MYNIHVDVDYSDPAVADQEMVSWLQDCGVGEATIQHVSVVYVITHTPLCMHCFYPGTYMANPLIYCRG